MATRRIPDPLPPEASGEPFHLSEAWARCWADAYGQGVPLSVAAGEARLRMALAPNRFGPTLASATNLQTCYFDLAGGEATPAELAALPARLLETGAIQVRIDWLGEGARLLEAAWAWRGAHLATIDPFAVSPVADCRGAFDEYVDAGGKSLRKYWKACRRHILNGPLALDFVTGGPGLSALLEEMFALEAAGWKGREGTAILSKPADARFYTALAHEAAAAGALRIATVHEAGRLLAYEYCIVAGDTILAMKVGYDEGRANLQLGHMLALMNIRDACADSSIHAYDMLGNGMRVADYKKKFASRYRTIYRVRLFARSPTGRALYALYRARPWVKSMRDRVRALRDSRDR
jgi:hypothetical protein